MVIFTQTINIYVVSSSSYLKGCDCHYSVCKVIMITWTINRSYEPFLSELRERLTFKKLL